MSPGALQVHSKERATYAVETIRGVEDVFALEPAWRELSRVNYQDSPFCSFEWFKAWWTHFGSVLEEGAKSSDLLAIVVRRNGKIVGLASFYFCRYPSTSFHVRFLRPVGVLGYRHSDLTEEPILLMERGLDNEILPQILSQLENLKPDFDFVQVHYIADTETKPEVPCRKTMLLKKGQWHESTPMVSIRLASTWEGFLETQSSKSQEHIRRKPKALAKRCESWSVEFASQEEIEWAVDELVRLHRIRAEAAKGRTIHIISKEHRLFYRSYFKEMVAKEMGGILLLRADGRVIAAQSVLFSQNDWLLYHQGLDPEWAQVSPPVILQMEAFRMAIEAGARKIRLHRFAQEWKLRWGAEPDGFFDQWMCVRRQPMSLLRTALYARNQACLDIPEDSFVGGN